MLVDDYYEVGKGYSVLCCGTLVRQQNCHSLISKTVVPSFQQHFINIDEHVFIIAGW